MVWRGGADIGRPSFTLPTSIFCKCWRNAFNYNRDVSNRNEFVKKSPLVKYAATGNNHALNLDRHGFCRDADTTSCRALNHSRTPQTGDARRRAERWFMARENKTAGFGNWNAISGPRGRATAPPPIPEIRANPYLSGSCGIASRRHFMAETLLAGNIASARLCFCGDVASVEALLLWRLGSGRSPCGGGTIGHGGRAGRGLPRRLRGVPIAI